MSSSLFPWQQSQWQIVHSSRQQGRLPHALLLTGPQGLGKGVFARQLGQSLLCQMPDMTTGEACGQCRSCLLFAAGSHPDIAAIEPLEGKKAITVDQIRELGHFLSLTSQYARHKVVIINPADAMNVNAANSLLKTLEEPTAETVLILVTSLPAQLPATIRSRCQAIQFHIADKAGAATWLKGQLDSNQNSDLLLSLAEGAPLKAKNLADDNVVERRLTLFQGLEALAKQKADPVAVAKQWGEFGIPDSVYWLNTWLVDMARLKANAAVSHIANKDIQSRLINLADQVSLKSILEFQARIVTAKREIQGNANATLVLEGLLIQWQSMYSHHRTKAA